MQKSTRFFLHVCSSVPFLHVLFLENEENQALKITAWFVQKIYTFFQGLFKDQIYFSRTLRGMSCYLSNTRNHSV